MARLIELYGMPEVAEPLGRMRMAQRELVTSEVDDSIFQRRGTFRISKDIFEERPAIVMAILSTLLVTRCDYRYDSQTFEYEAISMDFAECKDGFRSPLYNAVFTWRKDKLTFIWELV